MSYYPNEDELDFELGILGGLKKAAKGIGKGLKKVTDLTIVKPSAAIGGAIGGKKGRALGEKLGKITEKATLFGTGAGVAGVAAPALLAASPALGVAAIAKKKRKKGKKGKKRERSEGGSEGHLGGGLQKAIHKMRHPAEQAEKAIKRQKRDKSSSDNALAAKVAAELVAKLGKPLKDANKALKLADLQRTATYEHQKLMSDAEFRKKVLSGIAQLAAQGDESCARTVRVVLGRG